MERDFSLSRKEGDRHSLQNFLIEEMNLRGGGGVGKMDEWSQKVQTSSYKINKSWRCHVSQGDYNDEPSGRAGIKTQT